MRADRSLALWTMPISSPEACSPVSRGAVEPNAHLCSYELSAHTIYKREGLYIEQI